MQGLEAYVAAQLPPAHQQASPDYKQPCVFQYYIGCFQCKQRLAFRSVRVHASVRAPRPWVNVFTTQLGKVKPGVNHPTASPGKSPLGCLPLTGLTDGALQSDPVMPRHLQPPTQLPWPAPCPRPLQTYGLLSRSPARSPVPPAATS